MSFFPTSRLRAFTLGLLAASTLGLGTVLTGCDAGGLETPTSATDASYANLDGEALFSGLVLGYGPAAEALPEVHNTAEVRAARDGATADEHRTEAVTRQHVIQHIRTNAPEFFASFEADVTSGSPARANQAMEAAGDLTIQAFASHPDAAMRAAMRSQSAEDVSDAAEEAVLVLYKYGAVYTDLALFRNVWRWLDDAGRSGVRTGDQPRLAQEEISLRIAQRLTR